MAVKKLADLLSLREERNISTDSISVVTPMSGGLWGVNRFGNDPRPPSAAPRTGFVFGASVWGTATFGTKASKLASKYGVTADEEA